MDSTDKSRTKGARHLFTTFHAPQDPEICRVGLTVRQYQDKEFTAEAIITVTAEILPEVKSQGALKKGLPGYTFMP